MELPMQSSGTAVLAQTPLSTDHLLDAPLAELLEEFGVDVMVSRITDPTFTGATAIRSDGSLLFLRPPSRPDAEWEMLARAMLGRVLRVPMPDLPAPYQLSDLTKQ
jgi:hypothetical protein